ncbi:ABC transporter ATP-binding protein [Fodinicurvata sediminis]|uniref:ABC transporter ATP-binding protein n=1 Tax=Fodinicurvata sediminis TaxID=1121832 RepID=UPI0003B4F7DC|nr:ABC transporter ATP-binding protein [Fodinicurvata sediminis]
MESSKPVLELQDVRSGYNSVPVINGVSLDLAAQEILFLFGRNGVGKTTLLKTICGLLKAQSGHIRLIQEDCTTWPTFKRARKGIAYVPQGRGIFPKHTVRQNLVAGLRACPDRNAEIPEQVFEYFPILKERINQAGGTLSGGQQQMLAIARALCGRPNILLLDEPTEGIQPSIVQDLKEIIRTIVEEHKVSVLLVEQNFDFGIELANRCMVMDKGEIVKKGDASEFKNDDVIDEILAL